jgi:hypothetical protein
MHPVTGDVVPFLSDLFYQLRIPLSHFTKNGKGHFGIVLPEAIEYPSRWFHDLADWSV